MTLSIAQWHQRYLQQAQWSASLRAYCYARAGIIPNSKVLDVGCGTGVLSKELMDQQRCSVVGLDIDPDAVEFASVYSLLSSYISGDARSLPFTSKVFDVSLCHFVLLWVNEVKQVLTEMARVTKPNGYVLALAEPDYGGRIDYPDELSQLGTWQQAALEQQGADPTMGRKLRAAFHAAGLQDIEVGVMGGQWIDTRLSGNDQLEWDVLNSDLSTNPDFIHQADHIKQIDQQADASGQRILFVPTFYAIGVVAQ